MPLIPQKYDPRATSRRSPQLFRSIYRVYRPFLLLSEVCKVKRIYGPLMIKLNHKVELPMRFPIAVISGFCNCSGAFPKP